MTDTVKDEAKAAGLTLADVGDLIAAPKPRSWADVEERADEVRAAIDEPRVDVEADTLPTPAVYLHEHRNKQGRVVTSWFARR